MWEGRINKNTGGCAFPWTDPSEQSGLPGQSAGMTLRDYFAAKAMQGLVHHAFKYMVDERKEPATDAALAVMKDIGPVAYKIADAMIAEREKEAGNERH